MLKIKIFKSVNSEGLEIQVNGWLMQETSCIVKSIDFKIDSDNHAAYPYFCMITYEI